MGAKAVVGTAIYVSTGLVFMIPLIMFSLGWLAISVGAWMAWHPAGPVVFGAILMFVGARMATAEKK